MLTKEEKGFFISIARRAAQLSKSAKKQGSVLTKDRRILSYGYSRRIVKNWEISSVYDALFGAHNLDLSQCSLFCSSFPSLEDMKLIVATGVENLYFMGNIEDTETIQFINCLPENNIPLEITKLE